MPSTTTTTHPVPHYEVLSTFWAAACTARGTDLRGQSLVNLEVLSAVPDGFVAELGSKLRPAGIEYGLGQAGSGQSTGIDIADANAPALAHEPRGEFVQEMLATIGDLRVEGPHAGLAPGTLGDGEGMLILAVEARRLDLLARGERCQRLQAKIDTHLAGPMLSVVRNLHLQIEVPAIAGILSEAPAVNLAVDGPAEPEPVPPPEEYCCITVPANRTRCLEGDPSQTLPTTPSRPLAVDISRNCELLADRLNRIRVQAQELTATRGEVDQIEAGRPVLVVAARGFLDLRAVVPDPVHRPGLPRKMPTGGRILDPVPVCQHHGDRIVDECCKSKIDGKHAADIFTLDLPSAATEITNTYGAARTSGGLRDASHRRSRIRVLCHLSATAGATDRAPPPHPERRGFRRGEFI
jgi:hypothetical protein